MKHYVILFNENNPNQLVRQFGPFNSLEERNRLAHAIWGGASGNDDLAEKYGAQVIYGNRSWVCISDINDVGEMTLTHYVGE